MKKTVFMVILAMATISMQAQKFGLKAGVNISSYYGSGADASDLKSIVGFQVGGLYELPLSGGFYLQPSAMLSLKGSVATESGYDMNIKPYYLEVPVRLMYKLDAGPGKFTLAVGPYVGLGLFGTASMTVSGQSASVDLFTKVNGAEPMLDRFDMGVSSAIGYELKSGLFFNVESSLGLVDVAKNSKMKNTTISLVAGFKL